MDKAHHVFMREYLIAIKCKKQCEDETLELLMDVNSIGVEVSTVPVYMFLRGLIVSFDYLGGKFSHDRIPPKLSPG